MRKVIILILALLIGLFMATIVVDERQNAVITGYNGQQRVEKTGIHLTWPIWDKVTYVFINERTSLLTLAVSESVAESGPLQVQVLVSYHVTNSVEYLAAVRRLDKTGISEEIAKILIIDLTNKIKASTLDKVNQEGIFSIDPAKFSGLGVSVDQINLLNIKFIEEVQLPVKVGASMPIGSQNDNANLESAYYQASLIKSQTKLDVDVINQRMQIKDPKFYEYFKTLKAYEQNAKTKADVPPLSQIQN